MSDLYALLKEYEPIRRERVVARSTKPGDEFKPFAIRLKALKKYGWTLRDAMDFIYRNYLSSVPKERRIDNNVLSRKLYAWQSQGLFSDKDIEREVFLLESKLGPYVNPLRAGSAVEVPQISIMSQSGSVEEVTVYNVLDFLKECEKRGLNFSRDGKANLIEFFNNNHGSYKTLEGLVNAVLEKQKTGV
ncbi:MULTISPECIES: hypothetical protein [Burkholderia]|uniref:hypothetical protein n=1 Tax=Burkholderia TaxID=32008 RepID=UPI00163E5B43|nr:hypothetical protein [Burkholderia gladioli]